jgi:hypothetical protein
LPTMKQLAREPHRRGRLTRNSSASGQASAMVKTFKVGDHVSWNSEAGRVHGKIVKVHRRNVNYKGYVHHASADEPQYEIKSDKTEHVALHKAAALKHVE